MLHCADRSFYIGHTDDLERRVGQHQIGALRGYTSERLPVVPVWSQAFGSREEARSAEARIKGWSRAKKLALIRGDWEAIVSLAQGKKERASTSSAKSVWGVEAFLHPHLDALPSQEFALGVMLRRTATGVWLRYRMTGECSSIRLPVRAVSERANELWRHTCFELFAKRSGAEDYCEFNFSPSTAWAAYRFDRYRAGMVDLEAAADCLQLGLKRYCIELRVKVPLSDPTASHEIGLSAVIEETDGTKSYWALKHPPGPPDFHHPDCFALTLPAPD